MNNHLTGSETMSDTTAYVGENVASVKDGVIYNLANIEEYSEKITNAT